MESGHPEVCCVPYTEPLDASGSGVDAGQLSVMGTLTERVESKRAAQPDGASSHACIWPQDASSQAWAPKSVWHRLRSAALQGDVQNAVETLAD